jgi:hypothetical protein
MRDFGRRMKMLLGWLLVAMLGCCSLPRLAAAGECRALIICGDPGPGPDAAARFENWTTRWVKLLGGVYGFKAENIRVMRSAGRPPAKAPPAPAAAADAATYANVLAAFATLVRQSKPDDQVLLVVIGQGYDSQGVGKVCLAEKHLGDVDAGRALEGLRAKQFIAIVTTPASMTWAKSLGRPGRIVITATAQSGMRSQTYFCEFLLRALQPGNVNLLDAFNRASLNTIRWYQNQFVTPDATTVHGKEFQEVWKAMYPGRRMEAGRDEPQEPVNDPDKQEEWLTRRMIAEVAGLDDSGDGVLSTVLQDETKLAPLSGKSADGERASKVILGKP